MMHMFATMYFLGSAMVALAVIAAMLIDNASAIGCALGLRTMALAPLPRVPSRVRVLRNPRLAPMSPATLREVA